MLSLTRLGIPDRCQPTSYAGHNRAGLPRTRWRSHHGEAGSFRHRDREEGQYRRPRQTLARIFERRRRNLLHPPSREHCRLPLLPRRHRRAPGRLAFPMIKQARLKRIFEDRRGWGSGRELRRQAIAHSGLHIGYLEVDGVRMRYAYRPGNGLPMLFCNGIGANIELMAPLVSALSDVPMVLFDVPGTGGSEPALLYPSCAQYARFPMAVLEALGVHGDFVVAGVSWGGMLAQQIAYDAGSRVRGLILMATTPGVFMVPGKLSALRRMVTPRRYLSHTYMARNAAEIYGGEMRGHPERAIEHASLTKAPSGLTYFQQVAAVMRFSSLLWLHRIRCPALVLTGDDDPLVRPLNAKILASLLPNARLEVIRGGGHLFMICQADVTATVVKDFLQTLPDCAGTPNLGAAALARSVRTAQD